MNDRCRSLIVLLFMTAGAPLRVASASQPAAASDASGASVVRAARFERAPVIDGRMDDEAWAGAARIEAFHQVQPGDNLAPSQPTTVLIGYDRRALYLAFHAADTSGRVRATLARRDAIADDDIVGVYLDTFRDRRRAYYIFFNPYGIQADGIYTEGRPEPDLTVDLVIDSKGTIDADGRGYTVEAAIPFASLRYERDRSGASPGWGLHVQRFIRRDRNEQISWMPLSRNRSSLLDQAGALGAFTDIGEGRPLEIIPTSAVTDDRGSNRGSNTGTNTGSHNGLSRGSNTNLQPGISVNFGMTPTMNVAFTANPDFAQVEADQLVLTANQRFPIFYDEKRPFFLEGIDVFQTPINLMHTRTIVDPDYALKLTGRQGRTTIGVLYADDGADGAKKGVFRLKRDVGRESTVGATMTTVEDGEAFSRLVSADTRVRLSHQTVLTAQIAGSFADVPFRDLDFGAARQRYGRGLGYHARLERRGRHVVTALTASGSSADYRADLGFMRRMNINTINLTTTYNSEAFDRLHDALAPALKAYLTSLTRDATRADDLLQETFLQMHRARASHTPGEAVRPWVFAIAKRVFLMHVRGTKRRQRHEQHEDPASSASAATAAAAVPAAADRLHARRSIESALRQVPADKRRAFLMHHLFGFSFKEIAEKLGIEPGAAKIRSSRAAIFMRSLLREKRDE